MISGLQVREKSQPNEIVVTSLFDPQEYAEYAVKLLSDPNLLYIVLRSKTETEVPKVVTVASLAKRMRYKGGAHDEELHQYVKYDDSEAPTKGPKVINLDRPPLGADQQKDYRPPTALTIHLSKIAMPELQPAPHHSNTHGPHGGPSLRVPQVTSPSSSHGRLSKSPQRPSNSKSKFPSRGGSDSDSGKKERDRKESRGRPAGPSLSGALNVPVPNHHTRPASESSAGPASPRTAFWGFFSPGQVSDGQNHPQPQLSPSSSHHRAGSHQPISPSQQVPGSFPTSYFPHSSPPPPPPPPVQQQSGGLGSFVGGLIPHGQQVLDRFTKR